MKKPKNLFYAIWALQLISIALGIYNPAYSMAQVWLHSMCAMMAVNGAHYVTSA